MFSLGWPLPGYYSRILACLFRKLWLTSPDLSYKLLICASVFVFPIPLAREQDTKKPGDAPGGPPFASLLGTKIYWMRHASKSHSASPAAAPRLLPLVVGTCGDSFARNPQSLACSMGGRWPSGACSQAVASAIC